MLETHQIIVLNTLKYADDKIIVSALSRSVGRVTLLLRVTHSQRAAVRHTLFQPLAMLEVQWEAAPRVTMPKVKAARTAVPLLSVISDPAKSTVAMFLAEFLSHVTKSNCEGEAIFDYISYALQWFDVAEREFANFHIVFLLRLTRFLGIDPNTDRRLHSTLSGDVVLPYFSLQEGEYSSIRPDHIYYIKGEEAEALPLLLRLNFPTMHLLRLTGEQRSRILQYIVTYYRLHLPGIPEMKSLDVVQAVFR